MGEDFGRLKNQFIIDDIAGYWKEKMYYFEQIMRKWLEKGITVSVSNGEVVEIYGADELDIQEKYEIALSTEGFLYAEGQYECENDVNCVTNEGGKN